MIHSPESLAAQGLIVMSPKDWRVRLVFHGGEERIVRVSPGRIDEAEAVERAKRHAGILDESVLERVEAERVEKSTTVAAFGIVQK